jgi:hypothetical protein
MWLKINKLDDVSNKNGTGKVKKYCKLFKP